MPVTRTMKKRDSAGRFVASAPSGPGEASSEPEQETRDSDSVRAPDEPEPAASPVRGTGGGKFARDEEDPLVEADHVRVERLVQDATKGIIAARRLLRVVDKETLAAAGSVKKATFIGLLRALEASSGRGEHRNI